VTRSSCNTTNLNPPRQAVLLHFARVALAETPMASYIVRLQLGNGKRLVNVSLTAYRQPGRISRYRDIWRVTGGRPEQLAGPSNGRGAAAHIRAARGRPFHRS
jgi:hypothetical protein